LLAGAETVDYVFVSQRTHSGTLSH